MLQAKSFTVAGVSGMRNRLKETTLPGEIDAALNPVLEELGDTYKSVVISPLGAAHPDSVLVTVLYDAEAKPKKK